ncbi:hypothetical protein [Vibrio harveyi]|uniref:hypothetical protein n=1 Tax=Vibrio harveyi TaxID=669 RepID=UPI003CF4B810
MLYASGYEGEREGYYEERDQGVSFGIAYRFGGAEPIDCGRLYERDLKIKDMEIERMKFEVEALKKAQDLQGKIAVGLIPPPPLTH